MSIDTAVPGYQHMVPSIPLPVSANPSKLITWLKGHKFSLEFGSQDLGNCHEEISSKEISALGDHCTNCVFRRDPERSAALRSHSGAVLVVYS